MQCSLCISEYHKEHLEFVHDIASFFGALEKQKHAIEEDLRCQAQYQVDQKLSQLKSEIPQLIENIQIYFKDSNIPYVSIRDFLLRLDALTNMNNAEDVE